MRRSEQYNIVFVSSHLGHVRGGAELNDLKLGKEFTQLGHDVQYITQQDPNRDPRELDVKCQIINIPYLYGKSYNIFEPGGKILRHLNEELFRWNVAKSARSQLTKADLILTTGRPLLTKLRSATDTPIFHAVRGKVNHLYHRYLSRADGLIFWGGCESEYSDERVLSQPRLTLDPAVNGSVFYPRNVKKEIQERWRSDEDLLVVFVGRLEPVKCVSNIINSVGEANSDIELFVVGDGSQKEALEKLAANVAPENVTFLGYCEQKTIAQLLNIADVFALASKQENHPIALKEALACGTYCVTPNVGRVESMIPSDSGTIIQNNNAEVLAETFDNLTKIGVCADDRFTRAQTQNTWRDNAEKIIEFYEQLRNDTNGKLA